MSDPAPYVGEIRLAGFNFPPDQWLSCDGSLVSTTEYRTLFLVIGTTYGGDGTQTFALPDFRSRLPIHQGAGHALGELGGTEQIPLVVSQLAPHRHPFNSQLKAGNQEGPGNGFPAYSVGASYTAATANATSLSRLAIGVAGQGRPYNNIMPYLCLNFIICAFGVLPTQN